jgi:hypothetical protein
MEGSVEMSMAIEAQYTWVAKRNTISMDCFMELSMAIHAHGT